MKKPIVGSSRHYRAAWETHGHAGASSPAQGHAQEKLAVMEECGIR